MARRVGLAAAVLATVLEFVAVLYAVFLLPLGGYVSCTGARFVLRLSPHSQREAHDTRSISGRNWA